MLVVNMDLLLIVLGLLVVFLTFAYFWGTSTYDFWEKRGVTYVKPKYPFLGTSYETVFSLKTSCSQQADQYKYFEGKRYGGLFSMRQPVLFIRDPELIESVLIKDFSYFYNRGIGVDMKLDPLSAHLVNLRDQAWKYLRNKLTPVFTSGKLKGMHQQLIDSSNELVDYLKQFANGEPFEAKRVMSSYSINIISSCAFGLSANSLNDENSKLTEVGRTVFKPSIKTRIRFGIRRQYPWLLRLLNWKGLPQKTEDFFKNLIRSTIQYREDNSVVRHDFLHLMNELRKQEMKELENNPNEEKPIVFNDQILTANAFVFFVAGFETTASTLSFALYELAQNPDVQEKLYNEVVASVKKHGGETTFEALKEASYVSQVISETLRMHPPAIAVPRETTKPYQVPDSSLVLPEGLMIIIPIYSLHHDPQYFPEPDKFRPERFSEENKHEIKKCTYMPFGDGPRICIGARFAKLEAEVALAKIILSYKIKLNRKTTVPIKYNKSAVLLSAEGGIWIDLEKRQSAA